MENIENLLFGHLIKIKDQKKTTEMSKSWLDFKIKNNAKRKVINWT